ncbi:MAG: preprotein translocase subunit SecE [Kiritimatiellaeota bacterium]|nr:preprotein translocase subunit SecE [Kiritimatiellota bacterium]
MKAIVQKVGTYLNEVGIEFKKISWPSRQELVESSYVVITFIVIMAVVVLCYDKVIEYVLAFVHSLGRGA